MAVLTNDLEDIPVTLDHCKDGVIVLSSDMILFSDAQPRLDGRKIYHIFEGPVDDHESLDEEKLQLFTKASADSIENIQKILESNGISFDDWCPPITPLQPSLSSQKLHEKVSKATEGRRWSSDQENRKYAVGKKTYNKTDIARKKSSKKNGISEVKKKKFISKKENLPKIKFTKSMKKGNVIFTCCICSFSAGRKGAMRLHQVSHLGVKAISCSFCSFKTNYRASLKGHLLSIHELGSKECLAQMSKAVGLNGVLGFAEGMKTSKKMAKAVKNKREIGNLKEKNEVIKTKIKTFETLRPMKEVSVRLEMIKIENEYMDSQNVLSRGSKTKEEARNKARKMLISTPENNKKLKLAKTYTTSKEKNLSSFSKCKKSVKNQFAGSKDITPKKNHMKRSNSSKISSPDFARNSISRNRKSRYCKLKALRRRRREITKIENIKLLHCSECAFTVRDKSKMKKHILREHRIFYCSKCSFSCCNSREFEVHKTSHIYKCSKCSYSTYLKVRLKNHEASHEDLTEEFRCEECDFSTHILKLLDRHSATHKQMVLHCPECTFTCHSREEMSQHDLNHLELRLFRCKSCGYSTNYEEEFIDHNLSHYKFKDGQKIYRCSRCSYRSPYKATVRLHEKTHSSVKLQKCPHCDYECRYKGNLDIHILTKHANKIIIYCEECTFTCSDEEEMSQHDLNHIDVGLYRCKICNYATNIEDELEKHGKKHIKEAVSTSSEDKTKLRSDNIKNEIISGSENKANLRWDNSSNIKSEIISSDVEDKVTVRSDNSSSTNIKSETVASGSEDTDNCTSTNTKSEVMSACSESKVKFESNNASYSESEISSSNKLVKVERPFNTRSYKCNYCDYISCFKGNIKLHERNNHSENKKFKCPNCEYATDFKNNMELHSVSHIEGELLCFYCSFVAGGRTELRNHIPVCRATHSRKRRKEAPFEFRCEDCDFITDSRGGYYQHRRTHTSVNQCKCPYCPYACTFKANLNHHIKCVHRDKNFV